MMFALVVRTRALRIDMVGFCTLQISADQLAFELAVRYNTPSFCFCISLC
jgi:hypothetical protein